MKAQVKKFQIISISLIICINFSLFNITAVNAAEKKPTLWIKIHRIKALDYIEVGWFEDGADFLYIITLFNGEEWITESYRCDSNDDDVNVDHTNSFTIKKTTYIRIYIYVWEMDGDRYDQEVDIAKDTQYLSIYYNMKSNLVDGDYVKELGYLKTSGEWDGSEGKEIDENDAELWFKIWDDYDSPLANAGPNLSSYTGEKVNFDGSGSMASSGSSIVKYEWDFDDDGIIDVEGERTSFIFTTKGQYTVTLTITDSIGETDKDTCIIEIGNRPPSASFTYSPEELTIEDTVNFYDTSSDPDGSIVSWSWDFGDGHTSTNKNPTHVFGDKGAYWVSLTVTDNDGGLDTSRVLIDILNLPPIAGFIFSPTNPKMGEDVKFTDESQDPEGKTLNYNWRFGDDDSSSQRNPTHSFKKGGEYSVSLTVIDDEGEIDTITNTINIIQTYDLTLRVKDVLGVNIANAEIGVYDNDVCCASESTDSTGELTLKGMPEGNYEIQVKVMGATTSTTCSLTQTMTEQIQVTLSINTVGITGGIIVIAVVVGFYLKRRRKTSLHVKEEKREEVAIPKEDVSLKLKKMELERERITDMIKTFKEKFNKGEIDEETYLRLKNKYERELEKLEETK